ncbi:PPE family protein, SVP subgroup [Mycobacterium timonense]|uniref:PE family protein n=1 Tax=Mycobacterium timonense TaxID=701043 RepID=A0A7I9Z1Y3_9MYCO|nr:PE domain-containing protein [Mycobacterium timonense]GFG94852.1 PE family protein [Mycobacterium timonense]
MSFVTTRPEALLAAASMLEALGSSMHAQNAAAAAPTTSIAPAAADEVSALQAAQFSAYGAWYQQVSAQAKAIHQTMVQNLDTSAGSYGETETANRVTTSATSFSPQAVGSGAAATDPPPPGSTTLGTGIGWAQNVGAASSDFITLGEGQFAPVAGAAGIPGFMGGLTSATSSAPAPAGPAAVGAAPVLASMGRGPSIGALSVPPSWAAGGVSSVSPAPGQLVGAGFTSAAPHAAPVTTVPGGIPSMATSGRSGYGLGAPRYGVKPTVMPKPAI